MLPIVQLAAAVLTLKSLLAGTPIAPIGGARIQFSGYEWIVKQSDSMGPGPNCWAPENAFVDAAGRLHFKIQRKDGVWTCGEVQSVRRFGFGKYVFEVEGKVDSLDRNVVLGLFNYPTPDVGGDGTHEIDIEFARWGMASAPNTNYTVWPADKTAKNGSSTNSITLPSTGSVHRMTWSSHSVSFESLAYSAGKLISLNKWTYSPAENVQRISQQPEPVFMNLWLFRGMSPTDTAEVEIVVKRFTFVPEKP